MIVEAKAWGKPFVEARDRRVKGKPSKLICCAIENIRDGGDASKSPISKEWHDYLLQVREYLKSLLDVHRHHAERIVITNGQWMVIFITSVNIFCPDYILTAVFSSLKRNGGDIIHPDFKIVRRAFGYERKPLLLNYG